MATLAHELRRAHRGEKKTPPFEDTLFVMMMAFFTLLAQSVVGPNLFRTAGLAGDARAAARFRQWLGRLVQHYLEEGP
jgi:hypothetical protein